MLCVYGDFGGGVASGGKNSHLFFIIFLDLGGEIMNICFRIFILIYVLEDVSTSSPIRRVAPQLSQGNVGAATSLVTHASYCISIGWSLGVFALPSHIWSSC